MDLLLSLTVIGFQPSEAWVNAVAARLQDSFSSSSSTAKGEPLLLKLGQQQQSPAGIQEAGVLVEQSMQHTSGLQQLPALCNHETAQSAGLQIPLMLQPGRLKQ